MIKKNKIIILTIIFILFGKIFTSMSQTDNDLKKNINWARGIVWYQIFPERFFNGDPNNDPTFNEVVEVENNPNWKIHPWTSD